MRDPTDTTVCWDYLPDLKCKNGATRSKQNLGSQKVYKNYHVKDSTSMWPSENHED